MRYFIIAGDPSGDLHGSNFIRELLKLDTSAEIDYVGGKNIEKVLHKKPLIPLDRTAFMGFIDVLKNIRTILNNFKIVKNHLLKHRYDVVLLIDYPGFNLKMAKWCKEHNYKVYYYISPTVWAWKESRVHTIINYVDKLFCILPFEKDFYKKYNYEVEFVGHPLLDIINENTVSYSRNEFIQRYHLPDKKFIAILPGSRQQEIQAILPIMTSICSYFKDYHFLIAGISRFPKELYTPFLKENSSIIYDDTYAILRFSEAGIIKSGTSTMEAALFNVPQVVCYRGGQLSYLIARLLVRNIQYISMVNLIMGKEVVKELIQNDFNEKNLRKELDKLLNDTSYRNRILNDYQIMRETLGGAGASKKLAEKIYYSLKSENA